MLEHMKPTITEIVDLANSCPEKYQQKCFEILLQALVAPQLLPVKQPPASGTTPFSSVQTNLLPKGLTQAGVTQNDIDIVYHQVEGRYSILTNDLETKTVAKKQVRLALLLGAKGLMETGEPAIAKDALIDLCKNYSVFDSSNFATHMKNNKQLFVPKGEGWTLSVPGVKQAAELIKELAA